MCVNSVEIEQSARYHIQRIEDEFQEDTESMITDARYGFISGALMETFKPSPDKSVRKSDLIDRLHHQPLLGNSDFFAVYVCYFSNYIQTRAVPDGMD
jgi:ferrous iron transport protein B